MKLAIFATIIGGLLLVDGAYLLIASVLNPNAINIAAGLVRMVGFALILYFVIKRVKQEKSG